MNMTGFERTMVWVASVLTTVAAGLGLLLFISHSEVAVLRADNVQLRGQVASGEAQIMALRQEITDYDELLDSYRGIVGGYEDLMALDGRADYPGFEQLLSAAPLMSRYPVAGDGFGFYTCTMLEDVENLYVYAPKRLGRPPSPEWNQKAFDSAEAKMFDMEMSSTWNPHTKDFLLVLPVMGEADKYSPLLPSLQ